MFLWGIPREKKHNKTFEVWATSATSAVWAAQLNFAETWPEHNAAPKDVVSARPGEPDGLPSSAVVQGHVGPSHGHRWVGSRPARAARPHHGWKVHGSGRRWFRHIRILFGGKRTFWHLNIDGNVNDNVFLWSTVQPQWLPTWGRHRGGTNRHLGPREKMAEL